MMSPQLPEPKVLQQHPASELSGLKLLWLCLNEVGHFTKSLYFGFSSVVCSRANIVSQHLACCCKSDTMAS